MQRKGLFAVLDWGLGHATRSETIITKLDQHKIDLSIASSGLALDYLQSRFSHLPFCLLPDEEVKYSRKSASSGLLNRTLKQQRINRVQKIWLDDHLKNNDYDFIISDNVYGIYSSSIRSVLITHQLNPPSPLFRNLISKKIAKWINRFHEIWIPDLESKKIAGEMLVNPHVSRPTKFLGNISRFKKDEMTKDIDYLGIVSGPEPQAEILERALIERFKNLNGNCIIASSRKSNGEASVRILRLSDQKDLNHLVNSSKVIVCRSGYTGIIDLLKTKSKAILIPTPGQPEQVYLAKRAEELGLFLQMSQKEFLDGKELREPQSTQEGYQNDNLDTVLIEFIKSIEPSEV